MWLSEQVLYLLAKRFCRTEVAHSREMTEALSNRQSYDEYRFGQVDQILRHAEELGIDISDRTLLDLGCSDGAITVGYKQRGAERVVGVDIDAQAIERAKKRACDGVSFRLGGVNSIPLDDETFDLVICYDVFEHVSDPAAMLDECHRVMKPRAKMLIGTWGWYHPFAPHMWAVMPVPWAHVFVSERTFL
jgi:2-polyprenyl-3-methyl-5-hydroxy-6-metoxy-1,4-benzoquinol methylase